jgi:hypothetical protein
MQNLEEVFWFIVKVFGIGALGIAAVLALLFMIIMIGLFFDKPAQKKLKESMTEQPVDSIYFTYDSSGRKVHRRELHESMKKKA